MWSLPTRRASDRRQKGQSGLGPDQDRPPCFRLSRSTKPLGSANARPSCRSHSRPIFSCCTVDSQDLHTCEFDQQPALLRTYGRMCTYVRTWQGTQAHDRDGRRRTVKGGWQYRVRTCTGCHHADAVRYEKLTGHGPHASPTSRKNDHHD